MRLTAAILALLIALLSCLPCADLDAAPRHSSSEQTLRAHAGPAHEHDDPDLCSPFCHCACCAIASEITAPFKISLRRPSFRPPAFRELLPAAPVHISIPVWEPPR